MGVGLLFALLSEEFPGSRWTQPKLKWWQSTTRHELRLQNLTRDEIVHLRISVNLNRPISSHISMDVF